MKNYKYSIICEDIAHSTFIVELLIYLSEQNSKLAFNLDGECFSRWQFTNKSNVIALFAEASSRSFKMYNLDLLFIITDFDDGELKDYQSRFDEIAGELADSIKDKVLILLPVRAIETWLFHIKWLKDNPGSTKNLQNEIENKVRKDMKFLLYNKKKPESQLVENTVREIMQDFNPDWLCSRSKSFNHFHTSLSNFIQL